jgi:choline dehydrogenase-like flavoprotein
MIRSLRQHCAPPVAEADVCIIGGGTAGLLLAVELRRRGFHVTILESGDNTARRPREAGHECEHRGIRYRGAEQGRAFGLGGTSALWGGQLIPLLESDFQTRSAGLDAWPIPFTEVASYFPAACTKLGIPAECAASAWTAADPVAARFPMLSGMSPDFLLRVSAWLPFASRNFARLFSSAVAKDLGLNVWLDAPVTQFLLAEGGHPIRLSAVTAQNGCGQTLTIKAKYFVVCAGALESTRLLLEADERHGNFLTAAGSPLGRYFADHLSVRCGEIICHDWRAFNLAVAPVFSRGIMRTPRLELAPATQAREKLTSAFAHFTFLTDGETGFDIVRNILRRRQGEQQPVGLTPRRLGRLFNDVAAMAVYRYGYQRLWIPRNAALVLQVDIEQVPNYDSHVFLGTDRDSLGRRRLVIDWRITDQDVRTAKDVTARAIAAWNGSELGHLATMRPTLPHDANAFETLYDVYHPTGLLRMGASARSSVVDGDLRVWAMQNCFASTTAVFPSAGSANPGLTHLALTLRLADHLSALLRSAHQCEQSVVA